MDCPFKCERGVEVFYFLVKLLINCEAADLLVTYGLIVCDCPLPMI